MRRPLLSLLLSLVLSDSPNSSGRPRHRREARRRFALSRPRLEVLEDRALPSAYVVTTTADGGPGSLRDAINQVNADTSHAQYASHGNPSVDEIDFAITAASDTGGGFNATTGVGTITPQSGLPTITNAVFIDGYTQSGASGNTNAFGLADNAVLKVELNGAAAGNANGLGISAPNTTVRGLVINRFAAAGIGVGGAGSGNDWIYGNFIGVDPTGTVSEGNQTGIVVGTDNVTIGSASDGHDALERNLISGTPGYPGNGIYLQGSNDVTIQGNYLGTDATGNVAIANQGNDILAQYTNSQLRVIGNLISGDGNNFGVTFVNTTSLSNVVILGNRIGTNAAGTAALGNLFGIYMNGSFHDVTIGGTAAGAGNLISGNGYGISSYDGYNVTIQGNTIGTDVTGKYAIPNAHWGVLIAHATATNITIGGTAPGAGNLISGNGQVGVWITDSAGPALVEGNTIGTDVTGSYAIGNGDGIDIGTSGVTIGGTTSAAHNVIAFNSGDGVASSYGNGTSILGNSIHDNGGLGIALNGTNNNQSPPVLTAAQSGLGLTIMTGTITSVPNATVRVEFFANAAGDPEGATLLGSQSVTTDSAGNGSFTAVLSAGLPAGQGLVTATVTDPSGNTSAFSAGVVAAALPPASLSGVVWEDFNNDGQVDFGEKGISGVTVTLTGTDFLGRTVNQSQTTDGDGAYVFANLLPGNYYLTETAPTGYTQGIDSVGTAGGSVSATDQFSVALGLGVNGLNYNYGEQPPAGGKVHEGQTAGIGFWNNKNGQALIKALNGGTGTQLADWLAATLPNTFGIHAGSNNLTGKSNAFVAALFQQDFVMKGVKLDAQVLATALSVYATNATLDPTKVAAKYGFTVSGDGAGTATVNVGCNGDAFGVANNTRLTLVDLLRATDAQAVNGVLYNGNKDKRSDANDVYSAVNEAGDDD